MKSPESNQVYFKQWGENLDAEAVQQMRNACRLPVSVRGALMPDAHVGYGLPIGGVLATDNAVIPYAVGVDIACRLMMSVVDLPVADLDSSRSHLIDILNKETRFGIGAAFKKPRSHPVMEENWTVSPITRDMKERAHHQLGTSGSGNHFVEFGILSLPRKELGLSAGEYVALLSHSGSRGTGSKVAGHYSKMAMNLHSDLPKNLQHLAWLNLDRDEGREYWATMDLMGRYASANHHVIHREMIRAMQVRALAQVENHHNYAWKESHFEQDLIVHRKGATPAGEGALGIIPGSMASPAFVVRGKGQPESMNSAAHGAGRVMSRRKAKKTFNWNEVNQLLKKRGVTLISAGLDEVPGVYKNIEQVMDYQKDLVDRVARFDPRIVKMAPPGERPED